MSGRRRRRWLLLGLTSACVGVIALTTLRASAATTASATDVSPSGVKVESAKVTIFGINMTTTAVAPDSLIGTSVTFTSVGAGFITSDLAPNIVAADCGGDATSCDGVQLWRDSSTAGANQDVLDAGDTAVSTGFTITDATCGDGCIWSLTMAATAIPTAAQGSYTFLLAIRTSDTIANGDKFKGRLETNAFTTSPSPTLMSSAVETQTITADTVAPSAPTVTALGLSKAAGKVRVLGTAVSAENPGVLEVWRSTDASCIGSLTQVTESSSTNLTVTNTDLVGTTGAQTTALQTGFTAGVDTVCYRVRDSVGNLSPGFVADGGIAAAPSADDVALLGTSNVSGLKRVYAATDPSGPRTFRLYLRPGGTGLERAKSEAATPSFVEVTTSALGAASTATTDIRQLGSGATMAGGDGVAYSRANANGNDGDVTNDGTIPAAPVAGDLSLLSTSAADGHQRVVSAADPSPGRTFGLYVDTAGGSAWRRALTTSGGTTPVRVTTAATAGDSATTSIFSGAGGTTALGSAHAIGYVRINAEDNESDASADGSVPAAPVAGNISFSDALNNFAVNPFPAGVKVALYVGDAGANASDAYDGTPDGEATSTAAAAVGEFTAGQTLFYTAVSTSSGNESGATADGSIPAAPVAGDATLLSTSAAGGHQRLAAGADASPGRIFRLYLDPAGGAAFVRAATTSGGTTPVEVTTAATAADTCAAAPCSIFAGTTQLAGGHAVAYAGRNADGNDSDVAPDGTIPAAPAAAATALSDALDNFIATSATSSYNVNLHLGTAGQSASDAYSEVGPDATAGSSAAVSIADPLAGSTVFYTATVPATGNESATTADGDVPFSPSAGDLGLLGVSAATGHQRITASADASAPRTFRLYIDPAGGTAFQRAVTASGGSNPVEVTTAGTATDSGTTSVFAGSSQLAVTHAVGHTRVNANGNDSEVAGDGAIPASPDVSTTSATAANDTVTATSSTAATNIRAYKSVSSNAATAYGEGVDQTLDATQTKALDTSAEDNLFYTALTTASGNESAIVADGQIPPAPVAADFFASDARDEFIVPGASSGSNVKIFLDVSSSAATAYANGADFTATASPLSAGADLTGGQFVYYTALATASGNESPITADGSIPSPPTGVDATMSASAAETKITANPDTSVRAVRLYGDPAGGPSYLRATTTALGSTPVELTTSTTASTQSGAGIFLSGSALDAGASIAYARVGTGGNDSDLVTDGTIPAAPTGPGNFSASAADGTATVAAAAASGTYRVFRGVTPGSARTTHTSGTATTIAVTGLTAGDAVGYALTDAASANESPALADGTIPSPSVPDLTAGSDTGASSTDDVTSDSTPTFTGTAEASATVEVFDAATSLGTVAADGTGAWNFTAGALTDGTHSLTTRVTSTAGNTSATSPALSVSIDTVVPAVPSAPDLTAGSDTGASSTDDVTSDSTPTFEVTGAEAGSTVTIFEGATALGSAVASSTATVTSSPLADGAHSITAKQTDTAGNTSAASAALSVTVDTAAAAPGTPDLTAASDTGASSTDDVTSDSTPTFEVTGAEAGSTVTIFEGATALGSAVASSTATVTSSPLADGAHSITAKQTDPAGNTSASSAALSITVDSAVPTASITTPTTLTGSAAIQFSEDVSGVTTGNVVLRVTGTTTNLAASVSCLNPANASVGCAAGPVRKANLKPSAPLVPGQRYTATVDPAGAPSSVTDSGGNAVATTSASFRASRVEQESSVAARYAWRAVATSSAFGGSFTTEHLSGASAFFRFTGTSVTWYTVRGPAYGLANVYIDGVLKGTFNQYASITSYKVPRTFTGLTAASHTIRVLARGLKGSAAGTDAQVAVDAFKVGATVFATPAATYTWQQVRAAAASGGRYARADLAGDSLFFTFRGTGIDWYTVLGPNMGKAKVYIDGVLKLTVDNYAASTTYNVRRSIRNLTDAVHTMRIIVLGQKRTAATARLIAFDRAVVI